MEDVKVRQDDRTERRKGMDENDRRDSQTKLKTWHFRQEARPKSVRMHQANKDAESLLVRHLFLGGGGRKERRREVSKVREREEDECLGDVFF